MTIPSVTLGGDNPIASGPVIAIDPLSRYAYFAGQSSICQFSIGSSGSLTPLAPACAAESDSTVAIDAMTVDPSGRYLYALGGTGTSGLPGGAVTMYSIGTTEALAPLNPSEIRYSSAPVGIAISP